MNPVLNYLDIPDGLEPKNADVRFVLALAFGSGEGCMSNHQILRASLIMYLSCQKARLCLQDDVLFSLPKKLQTCLLENINMIIIYRGERDYIDTWIVEEEAFKAATQEERQSIHLVAHQGHRVRALLCLKKIGFKLVSFCKEKFVYDAIYNEQRHTKNRFIFGIREQVAKGVYLQKGYVDKKDLFKLFFQ